MSFTATSQRYEEEFERQVQQFCPGETWQEALYRYGTFPPPSGDTARNRDIIAQRLFRHAHEERRDARPPEGLIAASAKPLATEDFSSLPDVSRLSLSGSGEKIASVIRLDVENQKGSVIQVANVKTGEKKIVLFTDNSAGTSFEPQNSSFMYT